MNDWSVRIQSAHSRVSCFSQSRSNRSNQHAQSMICDQQNWASAFLPHFYSTAEKKNYQNGFISKTGLEIPKFVSGTGFDFH